MIKRDPCIVGDELCSPATTRYILEQIKNEMINCNLLHSIKLSQTKITPTTTGDQRSTPYDCGS